MTIVIMFKNGQELRMKCTNFKRKVDGLGQLTSIEYEGGSENAFAWIDINEILCIYRVMSDEVKE